VTGQVSDQLAVLEVPDLEQLVPSDGDNQRLRGNVVVTVGDIGGEANTADPVVVALILNGVLADTEGVPQLDGLITRTGDNLAVVSGESDGQDILGVAIELTVAYPGFDVPKAEGSIP